MASKTPITVIVENREGHSVHFMMRPDQQIKGIFNTWKLRENVSVTSLTIPRTGRVLGLGELEENVGNVFVNFDRAIVN